jgi:PAS domain S-box-containing protein
MRQNRTLLTTQDWRSKYLEACTKRKDAAMDDLQVREGIAPKDAGMGMPVERLADILDIAEDGIVTVNARQEIVLFNRGASKIFGYAVEEALGQSLDILIPAQFHANHRQHMEVFARSNIASKLMGDRRAVFGRRKDGTEFPAEITISKLEGKGEPLFTAIVRDATERKRHDEAILRLNQELEERVRARTAELAERNLQLAQKNEENEMFVYSVSHDLRAPLVNLEGFSEELLLVCQDLGKVFKDCQVPPQVGQKATELIEGTMLESISFIRTAVGRLSRIIDALLRLSRAGRVVYQPQMLDVTAVVRRVVDSLRRTADEKKAQIVVHRLAPAWGDATAVEQVFGNLIGNALGYLDSTRAGRVEVGNADNWPGETIPAGTKFHTYFVRDTGVGIAREYLPKLFQAFQRLHPDRASGEGIGLAIVRRILERLGGRITVESEEGVGTTFLFALPAGPN